MEYKFGKVELTCVELEKELGLARGDVREISIHPDGTVEVDVVNKLTSTQKSTLESLLGLKEKVV